ncbi:MAG: glycine--tRNA ligase subunit beta [Anaerolineales bacterium]
MSSSFQEIILKLQNFWAAHGCLIWQPYYTQVGAGTMNPATFLRVLGPEPWNVAYVEPSVRPDDGRYGENPNRFQVHYQYQVILKPDPGNPQELYLESLKALGIDPRQHDIRFVEDNWEQPAIAAWGLGWEVWLDGQEITQFTYFQQVGGLSLEPVAVEITYGLERILIALNNAKAIWDEPWGPGVTYGEVRRREEFEHSKYYFEIADVPRVRTMYDLFKAEAEAALAQGLVLPAHDYLLKCSHTFNILDTRGAIGVTERQVFFREMRDLARRVAEAYVEQRKSLGYPLLKDRSALPPAEAASAPRSMINPSAEVPCALEIGTEELPPADVDAALAQLRQNIPAALDELRIPHGEVRVFGTPRRLSVYIEWLAPRQQDREEWVRGPLAEKAFDAAGQPTQAALGFARKMGVRVEDLQVREQGGAAYLFARKQEIGRPTLEVLAEALPRWIAALKFEKSMRWRAGDPTTFSRPIRWLVALLGDQVIPFEYAGVTSGNLSRGLRPYDSPPVPIPDAASYLQRIAEAGILLDPQERSALIRQQVEQLAASVGGRAQIEEDLLQEVTHLVERPFAILGTFDPEFLSLPRAVLISVMRKHQRYFPVLPAESAEGLLPYFIVIRNGDGEWSELVRAGNEHVLAARFTDAAYFVREDRKQKLEEFRPLLSRLTFQARLGSMLEKSERISRLIPTLAAMLALDPQERAWAERAAFLAKADLVTQMVTEMTSLQGIMGREYALHSGEAPQVAEAIGEQYQTVPRTRPGLALALADRLDSLCGLFAVGLMPSGNKDPFALRRAALGIVQPLLEYDLDFDLRQAIAAAAAIQPVTVGEDVQQQVLDFLTGRLRVLLQEEGYRYDVIEAILAEQAWNPAAARRAVRELQSWVERADWPQILPAYARCVRILRSAAVEGAPGEVDPAAFREEAEKALYEQLRLQPQPRTLGEFLESLVQLVPAINAFFESVLVMAEEEAVRRNRLALVGKVAALSTGLADLSKLEGF